MFRANMSSSSGETTVFLRHLVLVILVCIPDSHPHNWFYLQDYTEKHGQQNIKFGLCMYVCKNLNRGCPASSEINKPLMVYVNYIIIQGVFSSLHYSPYSGRYRCCTAADNASLSTPLCETPTVGTFFIKNTFTCLSRFLNFQ